MDMTLADHLTIEDLGREMLVCDRQRSVVHRLDGAAAEALRTVIDPGQHGGQAHDAAIESLVAAGIVTPGTTASGEAHLAPLTSAGLSRRRVLGAGVAAAGAVGLVTMALPGAAAAASGGEPEPDLPPLPSEAITTNYSSTGPSAGRLRVFWETGPEEFNYTYVITIVSGTASGEPLTGTLSSGLTYNTIYNVPAFTQISVTFTSLTSPAASTTQSFSREA